ncbi:MAG: SRPBCC family protein [Sphingomonadales bacterium]
MMGEACHAERIMAPASEVWRYLDWPNLDLMIPSGFVTRIDYEERRAVVGATRRVWFADGRSVRERLEALPVHPGDYAFDYRIIDTGDFPLAEYLGSVRLTPAGKGACSLRFSARFTVCGASVEDWSSLYVDMQKQQIAFIRQQVEHEAGVTARPERKQS